MICEMQSRFAAALFKGRVRLPAHKEMQADMAKKKDAIQSWYYPSPRHTIQTNVREYLDELGEPLGCTPSVSRLLRHDPRLLWVAMNTPTTNAHYRLVGEGKCASAAASIWAEHAAIYKRADNRSGIMGLVKDFLLKLFVMFPVVAYCQMRHFLLRGKFFFEYKWI
jgi:hypothetical protein